MNLGEIRSEVFEHIGENEANPVFWTAADVDTSINEGYQEVSNASEWYELNLTIYPPADHTYIDLREYLGEDFLTLKRVYNNETLQWMEWLDTRDLDYHTFRQWERVYGEPQKCITRGLWLLGIYPKRKVLPNLTTSGTWGIPRYNINDFGLGPATGTGIWGGPKIVWSGITSNWGIPRNLYQRIPKRLTLYYSAMPPPLVDDTDEPGFPMEFHRVLIEYAAMDLFSQAKEAKKSASHFKEYQQLESALTSYVQGRIALDKVEVLYG